MNLDRLKYRYWQHTDWYNENSPLEAVYCNIVDGCDPTIAVSDFEFCTSLKDKNGNLIYEGDILDCELQDIDSHGYPFIHFKKGVVKRAKNGAYCVEGDDDFYASDITLYPIEIIGNIHKQAEQKD